MTTYTRPRTLDAAIDALASVEGAAAIAGGTDLMVQRRLRRRSPQLIVDVTLLEELQGIDVRADGTLWIGAGTTMRSLLADPRLQTSHGALLEAAALLGGRQIQAMATLGGNVCNASPAAETATPLLVHDAAFEIVGRSGRRVVPAEGFWTGPGSTVVEQDELLTGVVLPDAEGRSAYRRLDLRRSVDIAVVGASAWVRLAGDRVSDVRIAVGAVAPTPMRVPTAERILQGLTVSELADAASEAGAAARAAASPIDDTRASGHYRAAMTEVMTARAVAACLI